LRLQLAAHQEWAAVPGSSRRVSAGLWEAAQARRMSAGLWEAAQAARKQAVASRLQTKWPVAVLVFALDSSLVLKPKLPPQPMAMHLSSLGAQLRP